MPVELAASIIRNRIYYFLKKIKSSEGAISYQMESFMFDKAVKFSGESWDMAELYLELDSRKIRCELSYYDPRYYGGKDY